MQPLSHAAILMLAFSSLLLSACADSGGTDNPPRLLGGDTTVFDATSHAYSTPAPNLSDSGLSLHLDGDFAFEQAFVSEGPINPGLGPIFNNTSCVGCHPRDGAGRPPEAGGALVSMLFRISVPGTGPNGGPNPVPDFGGQLQDKSQISEYEALVDVDYAEIDGEFDDGEPYSLREPSYSIVDNEDYEALPGNVLLSPRLAPPVFGRGLLEAISEATIEALADPDDEDGDGISGKANYAYDDETGETRLGRFGWKAAAVTLYQQTAAAYHQDMGITNALFSEESAAGQTQEADDPVSDDPETELSLEDLDAATFYVQTLAVPVMRDHKDKTVRKGEKLFKSVGCTSCHVQTVKTGTLSGVSAVSGQTIHPYTDMLLHDMGEGLADNRPDFEANGREWRTPPLWGMGLRKTVNGHTFFLHDGRARDAEEAILWHGGEAADARDAYKALSESERAALLAFLKAL